MAGLQDQKRKRADEPLHADRPLKKTKTKSQSDVEIWESWENPPEFYDKLSKISLTQRALRELDRRACVQRTHLAFPVDPSLSVLPGTTSGELVRFSRHGGPDLRDLRGYRYPPINYPHPVAISTSRPSRSRGRKSSDPTSTLATTATTKSKRSSPYDRNFDLHLTENAIHPTYRSRKPDLEEARTQLALPRPSLSPSRFSEGAFEAFQESNDQAKDEDDVLANVIPTILGPGQANRFSARNTVFSNLEPLTDGTIVAPKPDLYWGAHPEQLARSARDELAGHIIPSTMEDMPMAPNFFMQVQGPDGSLAVATRQARHVGASGSRGMHSLQNYGVEESQYDGRPYTFNAIYHGGQLQLYAHHVTVPTIDGGRPEYHMTQLRSFAMTDTRDTFAEGAGALRNALDLAEKYRLDFIQSANEKASQRETVANPNGT
ncbi:hypothetical protein V8C35DRAFT_318111 [Trichoderma chlorosporum]